MENWKRRDSIGGRHIVAWQPGSAVRRQRALDGGITTIVQASGWIRMTIVVDDKLDSRVAIELVYLNTVHGLYHRG